VARRGPGVARFLGVWTAVWLAVFLVIGLLWLGDLSLQWPVLLVPVLWALVALRPRRRTRDAAGDRPSDRRRDRPRGWEVLPAGRTDTVERPAVRDPGDGTWAP
jgi:fatty acid desaturase